MEQREAPQHCEDCLAEQVRQDNENYCLCINVDWSCVECFPLDNPPNKQYLKICKHEAN